MKSYRFAAICASSMLTLSVAVVCHESGHIVAGWMAGGHPTLLTATEVKGNFDGLSPAGFVALGISGSIASALLCALGWWGLTRPWCSAEARLTAFFFFAVNGMLVATAMMGESMFGFGDWMTILQPLPGTTYLRVLFSILGTAAVMFMVRRSGAALARIVPSGEPALRTAEARRIVLVGAMAATVLLLGGSVANPVGTSRATLLALAAGLGPFIPIFLGARFVARLPAQNAAEPAHGGWVWYAGAAVATFALWFVVGPGVDLARLLPPGPG